MSEVLIQIGTPIIGILSGSLVTYALLKREVSDEKIMDKIQYFLEEIEHNEELQKRFYMIGGLFGKGLRDGVGLDRLMPKKRGGFEGIIMDLIGGFAGKALGPPDQGQNRQTDGRVGI